MKADQPILTSDEDRFGRKPFAYRIADVIATRDSSSGLVVGIHGPWGEGKTSVLNMIVERLRTYENVLVIPFNPWRFPDESLLLRSFFLDVARKIDAVLLTKKERLISFAEQYADVLSAVPYAEKVTNPLKAFARTRSTVDVDALRTRFEDALATSPKRVVVMMDDIDRLDKSEIQTVFRLVKLLADFPNMTYVLFFDDKRVAEALGEKYGHHRGGKNFLEKIIQVPLSLPPASRRERRAIAVEGLESALTLTGLKLSEDDGRRLGEIFDKGFVNRITTPRVAKRFGNALTFALPILAGETDIVDLVLIEGIRIFYPELYVAIRDNADAFSEGVTDPLNLLRDDDNKALAEQTLKTALKDYPEQDRKAASIIVQALFPRTSAASVFRAGIDAADFNEGRGSEKRIASREYFPRYFTYGVPSDDISDRDIERFLERIPGDEIDALIDEFKSLSSNNRAHVLIEKLRSKEDTLLPETAAILALVVALSGNTFPYSHPTDRFLGFGTISQASALLRHLLHRLEDASARERLAIRLAEIIKPLPFAYDFASWMRKMKRSHYSDEMVSVVSDETEQRIKEMVVSRIAASAEVKAIERAYPYDAQQLYQLWALADKDGLRNYLQRRISANPSDAAEFVSAANGVNPSSETARDWQEDLGWFDFICDLIPPEQVLKALKATYPKLASARYEFLESKPMNNRERAARWFQRLSAEKKPGTASDGAPDKERIKDSEHQISHSPLEIVLEPKLLNPSKERDEYEMTFFIETPGPGLVSDYRMEVEFPSEFLHKGWHPSWEVPERQSETHRFFRMTKDFFEGGPAKWTLYGKDKRRLFSLNFHVDKSNYRHEFVTQEITSSVYVEEKLVAQERTPMRKMIRDR